MHILNTVTIAILSSLLFVNLGIASDVEVGAYVVCGEEGNYSGLLAGKAKVSCDNNTGKSYAQSSLIGMHVSAEKYPEVSYESADSQHAAAWLWDGVEVIPDNLELIGANGTITFEQKLTGTIYAGSMDLDITAALPGVQLFEDVPMTVGSTVYESGYHVVNTDIEGLDTGVFKHTPVTLDKIVTWTLPVIYGEKTRFHIAFHANAGILNASKWDPVTGETVLDVYFFGNVDFSHSLTIQRVTAYDLEGTNVPSTILSSSGMDLSKITPAPVPEPETYALMLAGLGLVGFAARRRRSA